MGKITSYLATSTGVEIIINDRLCHIPKEDIADTFEKYGGSFAKAIGIALFKADMINTFKILSTWEEMTKDHIQQFIFWKYQYDTKTEPKTNEN